MHFSSTESVILLLVSGYGVGFVPPDAAADMDSQTLFLSSDIYTSRYGHVQTPPYHTIPYSFNNVVDIRNVQQIHIEIEIK